MASTVRKIGPYRVVEKIKTGSVGTVWKVADASNKVFALKLISEVNAKRSHKVKEFKKEAKLGRELDHRNIIKVHEYGENEGRPYFVMDFFLSENLKYCIWHRPERINKHEFYILRQIAESLAYLHAQGIIHKDLKPENILVGESGDARLIDLSLAQEKWGGMLPFGRKIEGTPLYMAPEQITKKKIDSRTDIYSFGCVAYELISKRTPFIGVSQESLFKKHLNEKPAPLRHHVKMIAPELEAMVMKCLEKGPEDRWQDMTSILYELGKWEKKTTILRQQQVVPGETQGGGA